MKPDFALLLSFEGIALLRRADTVDASTDGWYDLGRVSPDVPDLAAALAKLRESTFPEGSGDDPEVKLILPTEQVKFLDISAPDSDISVAEAVEAALDGATPYAIDELVYDFQAEGGEVHIAAVARETLDEAEAFAIDNGFLPLGFVSDVSSQAGFKREPFFGPTQKALTTLTPGSTVQGDDVPVRILDKTAAKGAPAPETQEVATAPEQDPELAPSSEPVANSTLPEPKDKDPEAEPKAASKPAVASEADAAPVDKSPVVQDRKPEPSASNSAPEPAKTDTPAPAKEKPRHKSEGKTHSNKPAARAKGPKAPPSPEATALGKTKAQPPKTEAKTPEASKQPKNDAIDKPPVLAKDIAESMEPPAKPAKPPKPVAAESAEGPKDGESTDAPAAPGFSSIRAQRDAPPARAGKGLSAKSADGSHRKVPPAIAPTPRDANDEFRAKARDSFAKRPKVDPVPSGPVGKPDPAAPSAASLATAAMTRQGEAKGEGVGFASRRTSDDVAEPKKTAKRDADVRKPNFGKSKGATAAMATGAVMNERDRMTVFGQRGETKVGGKPRFLGLVLTAVLILLMLGVAAFASIFFDEGLASLFRRTSETPVATASAPEVTDSELTNAPDLGPVPETALALPDDEAGANPEDANAVNLAALSEGVPALSRDLADDQIDGLSVPFEAEQLSPEQAEARYAATGIWQRAPAPPGEPDQSVLGDVYVASIDPVVPVGDAVAIPTAREAATDIAPPSQTNPYAADSGFSFDENGLIEPTPEGVRHPEGFLLVAGPPPLTPPLRPGVEQAPQPAALPVEPPAAETPVPDAPATPVEPVEPEAAVPATEADTPEVATDEAAEPVVVDPALAGFRPRLRPDDLAEQNERANLGGISLDELRAKRPRLRPEQAEDKTEAERNVEASDLAVISSLSPRTKPSNFSAVVARARRNAEQAAPVVAASTAGTVAPRTVTPRIPSSTTVAAAATEKNAINLRRVNLIGVYGKPSSRRALIRLANGRYKKVKVGDRIDGGRVAAIGDGQLSYVKSGRNIVLRMPRG